MSVFFHEPRQFRVQRQLTVTARGRTRQGLVIEVTAEGLPDQEEALKEQLDQFFGQASLDAVEVEEEGAGLAEPVAEPEEAKVQGKVPEDQEAPPGEAKAKAEVMGQAQPQAPTDPAEAPANEAAPTKA